MRRPSIFFMPTISHGMQRNWRAIRAMAPARVAKRQREISQVCTFRTTMHWPFDADAYLYAVESLFPEHFGPDGRLSDVCVQKAGSTN